MVAVQVAVVPEVLAVQELLHSLTLQAAVAVAVATVQISAGTVTLDILVVQAVVGQPARTIVQHSEQVVVVVQVLTAKVITALAVAHITDIALVLADNLDRTELAVFQVNPGQTVKDTDTAVVATTVAVVAAVAHPMVAGGAAKAPSVLFGPAQQEHIQTTQDKIFNII